MRLTEIRGVRGIRYRLGELQRRAEFMAGSLGGLARLRLRRNGARPQVAAVVVGRNDDYMSDFRERLKATIEWNTRHLVDEVVFVEWNPPADRELLADDLVRTFPQLRAYVVPAEVHRALCENPRVALLEYHAKNVGIRRAASPWVLVTNADAALGFDAVDTLFRTPLSPDVVWTAHRVDIPWDEGRSRGIGLGDTFAYKRAIPYDELGTGEFHFASRQMWEAARGYDESLVKHRIGCDVRGIAQMISHGAKVRKVGRVLHLAHPTSCTEGLRPHHGEWASLENIPYPNPEGWGMGDYREVPIAERIWRLERGAPDA
ncbi:MAG TPA: hypothetical protein VF538_04145 [Pyrinomonadaceae bacterium]|jgi:hypothetical protein